MPTVRVRVPASSANLGPGFDTLGLALNIYNFVTLSDADSGSDRITVTGEGAGTLSDTDSNIALAAVRRLLDWLGAPALPLQLVLENSIPLARGLGSSAAARIGALVAANEWARLMGERIASPNQILTLATQMEGHPDNVAAALLGGLVVSITEETRADGMIGKAARSTPGKESGHEALAVRMPVEQFPGLVVFIPESELSTQTARGVLPDAVFRADASYNVGRTALLLAALASGQWQFLRAALHDRLHQEHRAALMPGFEAIVHAAREAGAYGATLSGAGPSILAWLPDDVAVSSEVQQAMQDAAAEHEVFGEARVVEVDLTGSVVMPDQ